jgi:carbonic anhydrase
MRLFESIIEANHCAAAGDTRAGLRPGDFTDALPVVAVTCIDVRLNPLLPEVLGIPEEHFIWLRNAGNIITGPLSSTMRSLALACAIKGGKEIAIIGHTDCLVGRTTISQLIDQLKAIGINREQLPQNLSEFFGVFSSERQNVICGVDTVRSSPLIGPDIPVHGLLVETETGRVEWLVNGYRVLEIAPPRQQSVRPPVDLPEIGDFHKPPPDTAAPSTLELPGTKIGEGLSELQHWVEQQLKKLDHTARRPSRACLNHQRPRPGSRLAAQLRSCTCDVDSIRPASAGSFPRGAPLRYQVRLLAVLT